MNTAFAQDPLLRGAGAIPHLVGAVTPTDARSAVARGTLRVLTLQDVLALPPRCYFLPGLIAPRELSVWWGAPKCGKSFLLLRLAFGLAQQRGLWAREPRRALRVLYVAAEGEGGVGTRLAALLQEIGDPGDNFALIAQRIQIGPPGEHLAALIDAARRHRADLVVIDTSARSFGEGDEDRAQDMGGFIVAMDRLREEAGVHVAVVHHGPKDPAAKTPRGSGALLGAADLVVKITKGAGGSPSFATVEHAKDDVDGVALPFRLRVVALDPVGDAEPRLTCVAEGADDKAAGTARPALTAQARIALEVLADLKQGSGNTLPSGPMSPPPANSRSVLLEDWRAACRTRKLSTSGEKRAENQAFKRATEALEAAGAVGIGEHEGARFVWIAEQAGT